MTLRCEALGLYLLFVIEKDSKVFTLPYEKTKKIFSASLAEFRKIGDFTANRIHLSSYEKKLEFTKEIKECFACSPIY